MSRASDVFRQNDGEVTKSYYAKLNALGLSGELATALFRAQKRSSAAKRYCGGKYKRGAYEVKNWSLGEICRIAARLEIVWGWKKDAKTIGYPWVLYVELPTGQVSFHSADRLSGPDFAGEWDGQPLSEARILAFCDMVCGLPFAAPRSVARSQELSFV